MLIRRGETILLKINKLEAVEHVEPNQIYRATRQPSRRLGKRRSRFPIFPLTNWGLTRIHRRKLNDFSEGSADPNGGSDVHVYVFDTGINVNHPEFTGRATMDANFIEGEDPIDLAGHGTHVAGIVGGDTFGVAKNVRLHGIKILDKFGDGTTIALLKAIEHVMEIAEPGKSIINLSLSGPRSAMIDDALESAALDHNIPIFVSAGNSGDDACQYSPSANKYVFPVGASSEKDALPFFSAYGPCVKMYAPGTNIISSWLGKEIKIQDGTSMASPHVAGIAALLMSKKRYNTVQELYDTLSGVATENILSMTPYQAGSSQNLLAYAPA
ncbi:peptidase S8/S53 domain-containing protein [Phycomyces nitens]|nr:peptidase S8/S53 domain-containing protein [Phycomyces nitens]